LWLQYTKSIQVWNEIYLSLSSFSPLFSKKQFTDM